MGNFPGGDGGLFDIFMVDNLSDDNSSRQDGAMRLRNVRTMHHQNVPTEDLLFSTAMYTPSQFGQQSAPGRLDPGTMVYGIKIPGQNQVIVLGQAQTQKKSGKSAGGGGTDLLGNYNKTFSDKLPVNVPPDIKEGTGQDGVKIREIKEKGQQHSFSLLDGLPSHGASFNMAGFRLPELPNVPTAKQTNDQMMNNQMMEQMMGQIMSMGQMFQGLMGNRGGGGGGSGLGGLGGLGANSVSAYNAPDGSPMSNILAGLTPEMRLAVANLSALVQGLETNDGVAFFTGNVVHEETYLGNAEQLLSQVQTLDDLMYVLQRLQWDTDLFGHDKLQKVETEIETAWGVALQEVTFDGEVYVTYKNPATNGAINYVQANVLISTTGTVTDYIKVGEEIDYTIWTGTLANMTKTIGLSNGDLITAESNTGSLGANTDYAQGGYHRVVEVLSDTSIKFKTIGGAVPIVGNVANVTLHTLLPGAPYGFVEQAIYYNTMSSPSSSPSIGSIPNMGGGGGSGGGNKMGQIQGMMNNLFGRSSGTMQEMWKRLSQSGEKEAKQMHQKLNQQKFPQTSADAAKKTKDGESPLDLFKKAGA